MTILTIFFLILPIFVYAQSCAVPQPVNESANASEKVAIATNEEDQIETDKGATKTDALSNYKAVMSSDGKSAKLVLVEVTNEELLNADYSSVSASAGVNKSDKDSDCEGIKRSGESCYILTYNQIWTNPSVMDPVSISWVFLDELKGRATAKGDAATITLMTNAEASLAGDALRQWNGIDISKIQSGDGSIIIRDKSYFETIGEDKIKSDDSYVTINAPDKITTSSRTATVKLAPTYPLAKPDSLWLDSIQYVLGTVIIPWQEKFKIDLSAQQTALENHKKAYANYADAASLNSNVTGTALKIEGPQKIIMDKDGNATTTGSFTVSVDSTKFPKPTSGYKTQVYIKPTDKNSDNIFTYLHGSDPSFSFTWGVIAGEPYANTVGTDGAHTDTKTSNIINELKANGIKTYDKAFPQAYTLTAITYNADNTEKEKLSTNFDTVSASSFTDTPQTGTGTLTDGSGNVTISVPKSSYSKADKESVHYSVNVTDSNATKKINKVVIWSCTGTAADTVTGDSSNCKSGHNEQIVHAFATSDLKGTNTTWGDINYNGGNTVSLEGDWDISGSEIGTHALMAKAYSSNAAGSDVPGGKIAVTVSVTDSKINDGGGTNAKFKDLLKFGTNASANARGSSITSLTDAAERVINIILYIMGGLSVIAVIVGGIFYISSGGDAAKAEKGKKTLIYAVIGIVIAGSGYTIEYLIIDLINQIIK